MSATKIRVGDTVKSRQYPELLAKVVWASDSIITVRRFTADPYTNKRVFSDYETRLALADVEKVEVAK